MVDCIIPHGTLAKGVLNNIYRLQMGPGMVGYQPTHRHQRDPFVHRGSRPCLDRNPRYYRTAITAHLPVIPSFLSFCQTCSQWSIQLGRSLFCHYIGPFVSLDTHMRWNPHQEYTISKFPQIPQTHPGSKQHVIRLI
jgi:hypothetical protein